MTLSRFLFVLYLVKYSVSVLLEKLEKNCAEWLFSANWILKNLVIALYIDFFWWILPQYLCDPTCVDMFGTFAGIAEFNHVQLAKHYHMIKYNGKICHEP